MIKIGVLAILLALLFTTPTVCAQTTENAQGTVSTTSKEVSTEAGEQVEDQAEEDDEEPDC